VCTAKVLLEIEFNVRHNLKAYINVNACSMKVISLLRNKILITLNAAASIFCNINYFILQKSFIEIV
jgi:hypothetical protein